MKLEFDPDGKRREHYETPKWVHFGQGKTWEYGRCNQCVRHVFTRATPHSFTLNCWKVLVFGNAVRDFEAAARHIMSRVRREPRMVGKKNKPSDPRYGLVVLYTTSEREREQLRRELTQELRVEGLLQVSFLPYRRGCKAFEAVLGPWQEWEEGQAPRAVPPDHPYTVLSHDLEE